MFGQSTLNLLLTALITAMLSGGYFLWKQSVEQGATDRLRSMQMEQQLKNQEKIINDLKVLNEKSNQILSDMKNKQIDLDNKFKDLDAYLNSQPKDQKQSSEVLKRTFKELSQ